MARRTYRIMIGFGAGLLILSLFAPWTKLVGGPLKEPVPIAGYKEIHAIGSAVIGILTLLVALIISEPFKLKALGITFGVLAFLMPYSFVDLLRYPAGNVDCLPWPKECVGMVPDIGVTVAYLGCFFVLLGSVVAWTAASKDQENLPDFAAHLTAEQA